MQKPVKASLRPHPAVMNYLDCKAEEESHFPAKFTIYTDGSKTGEHVGCAFSVWQNSQEVYFENKRIEICCSVFQAELLAIRLATIWICNNLKYNETALIIGDSKSAIMAINHQYSLNPLIFDIHHYINNALLNRIYVQIRWTKAHTDNVGNDRADELAKDAINLDKYQTYYKYYPESYAKSILRRKSIENWSKDWLNSRKGWVTKRFFFQLLNRVYLINISNVILILHSMLQVMVNLEHT
jgi:ribonuclease HI